MPEKNSEINGRASWIRRRIHGKNVALVGDADPVLAEVLAAEGDTSTSITLVKLNAVSDSSPDLSRYDSALITRLPCAAEELPSLIQHVSDLIKPNGTLLVSAAGASPSRLAFAVERHAEIEELLCSAGFTQCSAILHSTKAYQQDNPSSLLNAVGTDSLSGSSRPQGIDISQQSLRALLQEAAQEKEQAEQNARQFEVSRRELEEQISELQTQNRSLLAVKVQLSNKRRVQGNDVNKLTNALADAEKRLASIYRTDSYRLGKMLVEASQSWNGLKSLPGAFWTLLQDGKKRRATKAAKLRGGTTKKTAPLNTRKRNSVVISEESARKYLVAFNERGAAGVLELVDPNGEYTPGTNAISLLDIGEQLREHGATEIEWPLAEYALHLSKDDVTWCGYFWAAVNANKPERAYRAIRSIEQLYITETDIKKLEVLEQLLCHPVYRLALLDLAFESPVTPINSKAGRAVYVLHNSLPFSSGGYATRAHGIANGLTLAGYEVIVLTRPGFPIDTNTALQPEDIPLETTIDGIRYERILEPKRAGILMKQNALPTDEYIVAAADALTEKFRTLRPSIVIGASNFQTALPAMIAAHRLGLPFVYEVRGFWEVTTSSRKPAFKNTLAYWIAREMEGGLAARADKVFTLTEAMRDELIHRDVEADKIDLLPNSCDLARFQPDQRNSELAARLGIPDHVPVIGYIGTFADYEGLETLAEACAKLKAEKIEFRLLMVGNEDVSGTGVGPITQAVRDIAKKAGFSQWLILPGRIPHSEVESYYSLIDIAPFPRKPLPVCEMVSPMKPVEAMAMKKAVLVSSVRALSEMVQHEHNGLIFEKGNIVDFSQKLRLLIEQPALRTRLGENGRAWVEQERTWAKTADKAYAIIEAEILHPKHAIHRVRSRGGHQAELTRYHTMLMRAYNTDKGKKITPESLTKAVYFLHSSLPYLSGGYATRAHGIIQGILAAGFSIAPYTRPGFPSDVKGSTYGKEFPDTDIVDGIHYHRIFSGVDRSLDSEPAYILSQIDEFEKVLRRERPAVVHGRSTYLSALPALIAARRVGIPFVYEVSGLWELVHSSRDKTGANEELVSRIRDLETFTILNSDSIITLTEGMAEELVARGTDRNKITLVPNCVSPESFTPKPRNEMLAAQLGIPPGVPVMGYVGTFVDYEGLDDLLRAAKRILARGIDCRVLLVGDGRGQQNHKELAKQLGDKVIMPGRIPHNEVHDYYSILDVVVYARKPWQVCEMVSPMKPFEAMALEKAIVASSVHALTQIVENGERGLIFEKGNSDDLAKKIITLFASPELRQKFGKNCREWVLKNRTWENAGLKVINVYRKTLAASKPS